MDQEDIDLIRGAYEAWNRRDYEAAKALLDPDVELDATARIMNPDTYQGHEGFQRLVDEIGEIWEEWRIEPEEFIEAGDKVVVKARARARGRASGIELDQAAFNTWTIRDGKVVKLGLYYERDDALRDATSQDAAERA